MPTAALMEATLQLWVHGAQVMERYEFVDDLCSTGSSSCATRQI